jgi:hypothetical protein
MARDHSLDFARLFGGYRERRPVLGFAYLDSSSAAVLPVAASADWWMAWYVNGKRVYSTLKTGNRHGSLADHIFELPLRAGQNIIAFQCLSGSAGWSIEWAGPRERALAVSGGVPPDRLHAVLEDEQGRRLAERVLPLELQPAIPALGPTADPKQPESWRFLEPLGLLGEAEVTNRFAGEPDPSRWYQGPEDLSAVVWLREDGERLLLLTVVRDDMREPSSGVGPTDTGDALRVVFSGLDGKVLVDQTLTAAGKAGANQGEARVLMRQWPGMGTVTCYLLPLGSDAVSESAFRLNLRVLDRDRGLQKQTLDLGNVDRPKQGRLVHRLDRRLTE